MQTMNTVMSVRDEHCFFRKLSLFLPVSNLWDRLGLRSLGCSVSCVCKLKGNSVHFVSVQEGAVFEEL